MVSKQKKIRNENQILSKSYTHVNNYYQQISSTSIKSDTNIIKFAAISFTVASGSGSNTLHILLFINRQMHSIFNLAKRIIMSCCHNNHENCCSNQSHAVRISGHYDYMIYIKNTLALVQSDKIIVN